MSNYTELMQEVILRLHDLPSYEQLIFEALFALQDASQLAMQQAKEVFANPAYTSSFDRIFKEEKRTYKCFISLLALSGCLNMNLADRKREIEIETARMNEFLSKSRALLVGSKDKYIKYFMRALKVWMQEMITDEDESKRRRQMHLDAQQANFHILYQKLCIEADFDKHDTGVS